jgi:hypothetical protein
MKPFVTLITLTAILAGLAALSDESSTIGGVLFMALFSISPLLITLLLSFKAGSRLSQRLLLASTLVFSAWFALIYLDAFYWNIDPQSAIVLLTVGILSLPVMIPLWVIAWWKRNPKS